MTDSFAPDGRQENEVPRTDPRATEPTGDPPEHTARLTEFLEDLPTCRALLEGLSDGLISLDPKGVILSASGDLSERLGRHQDDLVGRRMAELTGDKDRAVLSRAVNRALKGSASTVEVRLLTARGRIVTYLLTMVPARDGDRRVVGLAVGARDITARKRLEERLRAMSLTDDLTDLHNRRGFFLLGEQQLKYARRTGVVAFLFYVDLDNMKRINDALGHEAGDRALEDAAQILKKTFRDSDIVARVGGDEFASLALAPRGAADEQAAMSRLAGALAAFNASASRPYTLSMSTGAARYEAHRPCSVHELLAQADRAMYQCKRSKAKSNGQ